MRRDTQHHTRLFIIIFATFFCYGGTVTESLAKDFKWPMYIPALTTPKRLGVGSITLRLKNDVIPHFDESASAECELQSHTLLRCGAATLHYDATEDNGQLRIRRNGSITFMPVGTCTQNQCIVEHQASVEEVTTLWVWTGTIWKEYEQNSVSDNWDDTLQFNLQEAANPGGTTIGTTTSTGSAYWTFTLGAIM